MNHRFLWVFLLILLTGPGSCRKKDQVNASPPPDNPDREDSTLTPDDPDFAGGAPLVDPQNGALSVASASERIDSYNGNPVIWNQSGGNIVIGETDYTSWVNEFNELFKLAKKGPAFDAVDQNEQSTVNGLEPTTISGLVIQRSYTGPIMMRDGKAVVPVQMGSSLSQLATFTADESTPWGPETAMVHMAPFFREFFRYHVVGDPDNQSGIDCFQLEWCGFNETAIDRGQMVWWYNFPETQAYGGMYFTITGSKYLLTLAYFDRKEKIAAPGILAEENVILDLLTGTFTILGPEGEETVSLGQPFDEVSQVAQLPADSHWVSQSSQITGRFRGMNITFKKNNQQALGSKNYLLPDGAQDTLRIVSLGSGFRGRIYFGDQGERPVYLPTVGVMPPSFTTIDHVRNHEILKDILVGREGVTEHYFAVHNAASQRAGQSYTTEVAVSYKDQNQKDRHRVIEISTSLVTSAMTVLVKDISDDELKLRIGITRGRYDALPYQMPGMEVRDALADFRIDFSIGGITPGDEITLNSFDLVSPRTAVFTLPDQIRRAGTYYPDISLATMTGQHNEARETMNTYEAIAFENLILFLRPCGGQDGGTCRVVTAIQANNLWKNGFLQDLRFAGGYKPDQVFGPEVTSGLMTSCGHLEIGKTRLGDLQDYPKDAAYARIEGNNVVSTLALENIDEGIIASSFYGGCSMFSYAAEAANEKKSIWFIPNDRMALYFNESDSTILSDIVIYE